jgi:hypothetical protein
VILTVLLAPQNKSLSDSPEPALALQGIGFLTRKAIGLATVTLHVKQYTAPPDPPSDKKEPVVHIDIEQTATGGIKGTAEHRNVDDVDREHSDWLFGKGQARSRWLGVDGLPAIAAECGEWLTKGWLEDGEGKGPGGESHLWNAVVADAGWTAVMVWGFQTIGSERRYVRLIQVSKGDQKVEIRFVYDFVPQ